MARTLESGCYCTNLRCGAEAVTDFYDAALKPSGLTMAQYSVLVNLSQMNQANIIHWAERVGLERSTLVRNLKPMQDCGLIEATEVHGKVFRLSEAGKEVLACAVPLWEQVQVRMKEFLGEDAETVSESPNVCRGWKTFDLKVGSDGEPPMISIMNELYDRRVGHADAGSVDGHAEHMLECGLNESGMREGGDVFGGVSLEHMKELRDALSHQWSVLAAEGREIQPCASGAIKVAVFGVAVGDVFFHETADMALADQWQLNGVVSGQRGAGGLDGAGEVAGIDAVEEDGREKPTGTVGVGEALFGEGQLCPAAVALFEIGDGLTMADKVEIHVF